MGNKSSSPCEISVKVTTTATVSNPNKHLFQNIHLHAYNGADIVKVVSASSLYMKRWDFASPNGRFNDDGWAKITCHSGQKECQLHSWVNGKKTEAVWETLSCNAKTEIKIDTNAEMVSFKSARRLGEIEDDPTETGAEDEYSAVFLEGKCWEPQSSGMKKKHTLKVVITFGAQGSQQHDEASFVTHHCYLALLLLVILLIIEEDLVNFQPMCRDTPFDIELLIDGDNTVLVGDPGRDSGCSPFVMTTLYPDAIGALPRKVIETFDSEPGVDAFAEIYARHGYTPDSEHALSFGEFSLDTILGAFRAAEVETDEQSGFDLMVSNVGVLLSNVVKELGASPSELELMLISDIMANDFPEVVEEILSDHALITSVLIT